MDGGSRVFPVPSPSPAELEMDSVAEKGALYPGQSNSDYTGFSAAGQYAGSNSQRNRHVSPCPALFGYSIAHLACPPDSPGLRLLEFSADVSSPGIPL